MSGLQRHTLRARVSSLHRGETASSGGLAEQAVNGPAEAWWSPAGAPSAQTATQDGPSHEFFHGGERIPNPRRGRQTQGSQGEAFRGAGRDVLSTRRGSSRDGVEGSYLRNLKTQSVPTNGKKMSLMFAGQTNGPEQGAGEARLRLCPGARPGWRPAMSRLVLYTAVLVYLEFSSNSRDLSCLCPSLRPRGRLSAAVTFGLLED